MALFNNIDSTDIQNVWWLYMWHTRTGTCTSCHVHADVHVVNINRPCVYTGGHFMYMFYCRALSADTAVTASPTTSLCAAVTSHIAYSCAWSRKQPRNNSPPRRTSWRVCSVTSRLWMSLVVLWLHSSSSSSSSSSSDDDRDEPVVNRDVTRSMHSCATENIAPINIPARTVWRGADLFLYCVLLVYRGAFYTDLIYDIQRTCDLIYADYCAVRVHNPQH